MAEKKQLMEKEIVLSLKQQEIMQVLNDDKHTEIIPATSKPPKGSTVEIASAATFCDAAILPTGIRSI